MICVACPWCEPFREQKLQRVHQYRAVSSSLWYSGDIRGTSPCFSCGYRCCGGYTGCCCLLLGRSPTAVIPSNPCRVARFGHLLEPHGPEIDLAVAAVAFFVSSYRQFSSAEFGIGSTRVLRRAHLTVDALARPKFSFCLVAVCGPQLG